MANKKNGTIYIGSTIDLYRRLLEHQNGLLEGFTKRYGLTKCVYIEICYDLETALKLERRYKFYKRQWKIDLIEKTNPEWMDLSEQLSNLC